MLSSMFLVLGGVPCVPVRIKGVCCMLGHDTDMMTVEGLV